MNKARAKTWHDDDRFWKTFGPVMFPTKRWEATPAEVERVVALLGLEPPAAVLDLCCGPGRHSLELARRGFRVTGVDRTAAYLRKARKQAKAERLDVEFVQRDMRRFLRPGAFDGAINLFTSFGYFKNPADDRRVLTNLHRSLKPGGRLVMDMHGKETLARIFAPRTWERTEDGSLMIEERKICDNWSWVESRWILLKGRRRHEFTISHRLYAAAELVRLLTDVGFRKVDIYGDFTGSPYGHTARRLVAVAKA